jgi:Fe-S-cluster containining protein
MENQTVTKKKFECQRCGFCCIYSYPSFDRDDVKRIKNLEETRKRNVHFNKYKFGVKADNLRKGKAIGVEYCYFTDNGLFNYTIARFGKMAHKPCEFLDKDEEGKHFCSIYSKRPSVCRDFAVKEWECPRQAGLLDEIENSSTPNVNPVKKNKLTFNQFLIGLFTGSSLVVILVSIIVSCVFGSMGIISERISGIIPVFTIIVCVLAVGIILLRKNIQKN